MSLEHIDPYPWFLNKTIELAVNDRVFRTRITATEWADYWRPFLAKLYELWIAHYPRRFIIAIAGPPGSGKSVLAETLHFMLDKGFLHKDCHTIALPMDGFHFTNAYLSTHSRRLSDGAEIPLLTVKGQPDTIDVARFRRYMQALIQRPEYVPWPGYSRHSHDVVPDQYKVHSSVNLVIVEGNYLLIDRGPFHGIPELFNLKLYVETPAPKIIANLMERHISSGKEVDQAKDWVKRIDLPNARLVETSRHNADVTFERDSDNDIAAVYWRGELSPGAIDKAAEKAEADALAATHPAPPIPSASSHGTLPAVNPDTQSHHGSIPYHPSQSHHGTPATDPPQPPPPSPE